MSLSLAIRNKQEDFTDAHKFPVLNGSSVCPGCDKQGTMRQVIHCIDTNHQWSRQDVADWLELIEIMEEPLAVEPTPDFLVERNRNVDSRQFPLPLLAGIAFVGGLCLAKVARR
jgi:hypothetical protein